jgi:hypothetical protein
MYFEVPYIYDILPRKEEGFYAYYLQVGWEIIPTYKCKIPPLLRNRWKSFPPPRTVVYVCLGSWYPLPWALWWVQPTSGGYSQNVGLDWLRTLSRPLILRMLLPKGFTLLFPLVVLANFIKYRSWCIDPNLNQTCNRSQRWIEVAKIQIYGINDLLAIDILRSMKDCRRPTLKFVLVLAKPNARITLVISLCWSQSTRPWQATIVGVDTHMTSSTQRKVQCGVGYHSKDS